jgi:hypothetical protein
MRWVGCLEWDRLFTVKDGVMRMLWGLVCVRSM